MWGDGIIPQRLHVRSTADVILTSQSPISSNRVPVIRFGVISLVTRLGHDTDSNHEMSIFNFQSILAMPRPGGHRIIADAIGNANSQTRRSTGHRHRLTANVREFRVTCTVEACSFDRVPFATCYVGNCQARLIAA